MAEPQHSTPATRDGPTPPRRLFDGDGLLSRFAQPWRDSEHTLDVYASLGHALIMAQRLEVAICILLAVIPGSATESTAEQLHKLLEGLDKKTLGQLHRQLSKLRGGEYIAAQLEPALRQRNDVVHNFLRTDDRMALMGTPAGCAELVHEARSAGQQFQKLAGSIFAMDLVAIAVQGFLHHRRTKGATAVANALDVLAQEQAAPPAP